jgi:hypothetical protein
MLAITSPQCLDGLPVETGSPLPPTDASRPVKPARVFRLPDVTVELADPEETNLTRQGVYNRKRQLDRNRVISSEEAKGMGASTEKYRLFKVVQDCIHENKMLEQHLNDNFIPGHAPDQFLGPRVFFVSPLFHVRSVSCPRQQEMTIELATSIGRPWIEYRGPELRQSDGLVFLSLLNVLRDVQIGTAASFSPEAMCTALFGRYDGHTRDQLRDTLLRLQRAFIVFKVDEEFKVRLCDRFDQPKVGPWTVALDKRAVDLFNASPVFWFSMPHRLRLPEGLPTWLLTYVESQSKLIPMSLVTLHKLCGSNAKPRSFLNRMRVALQHLSAAHVIDTGWFFKRGFVHWRKPSSA